MLRRRRVLWYISMAMITFPLIACAPSAAKRPAETVASAPVPQRQTPSNSDLRKAQTETSLEALQKGETSATPEESPLKEIYFDFDDYRLRADAREALQAEAAWLRKHPSVTAQVEGHCDERGTSEYNLALGAKRAQSAKDYLASLGIAPSRLSTNSYGSEVPVCREHRESCWQKNRRDRFATHAAGKSGVS